ncbi:MAG: rod shape-determining protein MreD [Butyrivibrio sp.]|uniref:rod shape-determining protein MreD n=1 Tax=Butyrivibrio sp. TaxID=28121 RepID=UPI0025EFF39D|nr:rod shape-determining protein MreD [Butyrivibrio sp.]MCR5772347.1 rod shape-determining protein MreD [Butyrivibrio sp.]
MRKFLVTLLMIIACFVLQTAFFRYFAFGGTVPNCLMIITCSSGIMRGEKHGLLAGFITGILVDIFFGDFIGIYAILYMYAGFFAGLFHKIFFPENIILPLTIIIVGDFIYQFLCYVLFFLLRAKFQIGHYMTHQIIPEVVYTAIIALFLYPIILKINTKLDDIIQRSATKFV